MTRCRSRLQMKAFIGQAIGCLKMRHSIFILLFLAVTTSHAAVQCRSILRPPHSQPEIKTTLDRLASLRIQIDLAQAHGQETPAARAMKVEFANKYKELIKYYENKFTESEVRQILSQKIREQQGLHEEKEEQTTKARQAEAEALPTSSYERTDRLNLDNDDGYISKVHYDAKRDTLYYIKSRRLMKLTLKDGFIYNVSENAVDNFALMGDEILLHEEFEHIFRVNLDSKERVELPVKRRIDGIGKAISPSGEILAVSDNNELIFIDVKTGTELNRSFVDWSYAKPKQNFIKKLFGIKNPPPPTPKFGIDEFDFMTENLVLIKGKQGSFFNNAVIFNLSTGQVVQTSLREGDMWQVVVNESTGTIIFVGRSGINVIKIDDLSQFSQKVSVYSHNQVLGKLEGTDTRISNISFLEGNVIAVTTWGPTSAQRQTLIKSLDGFKLQEILHSEEDLGTATKARIFVDSANNRFIEIGAHRDKDAPNGYSDYFVDFWRKQK